MMMMMMMIFYNSKVYILGPCCTLTTGSRRLHKSRVLIIRA